VAFLFEENMTKPTQQKKPLTKEEVITELKQCAKKLGHVPTQHELSKMSRITIRHIHSILEPSPRPCVQREWKLDTGLWPPA
jgi:hypothetical protein